jgi:hypothetical protein
LEASPEAFCSERVTGSGLQISLEGFGFGSIGERDVADEPPRLEFRCVPRLSGVVLLEAKLQVCG